MRNSDDLASQCIEHIIKWLNGSIDMYDNERVIIITIII